MQSVVWDEAVKINGADPDFHRRDLWNAIQAGDFPQWDLAVQVFDDEFADSFDFDVLDPTKLIPEEVLPVRVIARLTLDRLVENVFAETEQAAFCTQNIVPGVDFSNDPLLQGRNFSYLDTQLKRLGSTNFTQLPVNAPRCPVAHFQRDGHMQMSLQSGRANYEPNSFTGDQRGPRPDLNGGFRSSQVPENGDKRRIRAESFADHYSPGAAVVSEPDAGRAGAHHRRLHVRARHVRDPGHPHPDARQPPQRRRVVGLGGRRRTGYAVAVGFACGRRSA